MRRAGGGHRSPPRRWTTAAHGESRANTARRRVQPSSPPASNAADTRCPARHARRATAGSGSTQRGGDNHQPGRPPQVRRAADAMPSRPAAAAGSSQCDGSRSASFAGARSCSASAQASPVIVACWNTPQRCQTGPSASRDHSHRTAGSASRRAAAPARVSVRGRLSSAAKCGVH